MKRLLVLLAILALAGSAFADHPTKERGFRADSLYQFTDLDTINLYNGSVNIMLPIGQTYTVSPSVSYSFALRYASNLWSETEVCGGKDGDACRIHYTWRNDNAGFGWNLTFGEYDEPAIVAYPYWGKVTTPDGSEHQFYPTLHDGETAVTGVYYTRDNTYLRRKDAGTTARIIEFPNGVRHRYEFGTNNAWYLRYIYDAFSTLDANGLPTSNFVRIDRTFVTDSVGAYTSKWDVIDSIGRRQTVNFKRISPVNQIAIDTIDLQAFGGTRAVYDLGYNATSTSSPLTDGTPRVISRPCHNTDDNTATLTVNMLRQLRLSKGNPASPSEPPADFTMVYDEGIAGSCSATSGLMTSLTLPTFGRYAWVYRPYNFASPSPFDESVGVSRRLVYDKTGNVIQARHYDGDASGVNVLRTMKVPGTATDETGATVDFKAVHYFDISDGLDAGLPFTTAVTDGTTTARYLSSETFDCNEASAAESCNATPERREYVKYERDTCPGACTRDLNRRVFTERSQYTTDSLRTADTTRSSFDGLGHYRTTTTAGTFAAGNVRTDTTNYNPGAGTYPGSFVPLGTTSPWLLETYSDRTSTEGTSTAKRQYCFNATNGSLERVRTQAGTAVAANDLLSVFIYDTAGNITSERYYGGDAQSISTGTALCSLTIPTSIPYRIAHTYQYGTRKTTEYQTGSGASVGFKSEDYDVDLSSGWISTSRDTAGFATAFEFDALGRLTWELPAAGGDAYTEYVYSPATTSTVAKVAVNKRPNNNRTGTPLARSEYQFDALGRLWQERSMTYNGLWNLRESGYDWAGRKAYETVTGADGSNLQRTSYAYDLFGRATSATLPDSHVVTTAYTGVRQIDRTATVKSSSGAEVPATTTEIYDRQGRLYQVKEASRPDGANATTTYTYDAQSKLVGVSIAGQEGTQSRSFAYDGRGLLTSETHPEGGTTTYLYDARGHATKRADSFVDMRTIYDRAERPSTIYEVSGAVWKSFTYSTANTVDGLGNTSWSQGKMTQALRHNPFPEYGTDVTITETYVYAGRNGRTSKRDTTSSEGTAFTQSFTYNDLGLITTQTYPACTAVCTGSGISLTNGYTNGHLTSVGTYAGAISYHPNGLVSQATFGGSSSAIKWTQQIDANGMARPASIALSGTASANWNSGTYQYDGTGNIMAIGTDTYYYDKVSRLTNSSIASGQTQTATYDSFGNIKSMTTNGIARTMSVSAATNRLSTITDAGTATTVVYDTRGNVTSLRGNTFDYDALGMPRAAGGATRNWIYLYTPSDERIWAYDMAANRSTWTVRGLDNKPLAEWINDGTTGWSGPVNYIYRNGTLHASYSAGRTPATMYYAVDHLGTPRKIIDAAGNAVGTHTYYAFGQELTNPLQDTQRLKFTSHERDFLTAGVDAIDFMHARQYSPWAGRFLAVDPTWSSADLGRPLSWNRYSYVMNNPVYMIDADGRCPICVIVVLGVVGGMFLSPAPANAPAPGDPIYRNNDPAGISGTMQGVAIAGAGNAATGAVSSYIQARRDGELAQAPRDRADQAQADGKTSGAASAFRSSDGKIHTGVSGSGKPNSPQTQQALDAVPQNQRSAFHSQCAECNAISNAEQAGSPTTGGSMRTVNIRKPGLPAHGTPKPPCSTCEAVMTILRIFF